MTSDNGEERGLVRLADGGNIAYEWHGRCDHGLPLLLVRPLGGSMALWGEFRERLAQYHRVLSFDFRGTGRSSGHATWLGTRGLAQEAVCVLDHVGVERVHVFGLSLGGMAASWLAIDAPTRVAGLCIASAPARGIELSVGGVHRELAMAACFLHPRQDVEASLVSRVLSREFRRAHPGEVARIERIVAATPASRTSLLKHALAGLRHDARAALPRIHSDTLVLAGSRDGLLDNTAPRALAAAIPGALFEIIADSGHDLTIEQPTVTASRVSRFLAA